MTRLRLSEESHVRHFRGRSFGREAPISGKVVVEAIGPPVVEAPRLKLRHRVPRLVACDYRMCTAALSKQSSFHVHPVHMSKQVDAQPRLPIVTPNHPKHAAKCDSSPWNEVVCRD